MKFIAYKIYVRCRIKNKEIGNILHMANVKLNIFNLLDQIELECMYFGRRHIIYIIAAVVCA